MEGLAIGNGTLTDVWLAVARVVDTEWMNELIGPHMLRRYIVRDLISPLALRPRISRIRSFYSTEKW